MMEQSRLTTFFLACSEPRAWLVINSGTQDSRVLEMCKGYPGHWSASAWLLPGDYRCRYYSGDDTHVDYQGPATLGRGQADGLDGVVSISIPFDAFTPGSMQILVVEDNLTSLLAMEKLLKRDGYIVHIAEGYQTALDVAKRHTVHLAICDINLWDGDGCDLLLELRKIHAIQAIAVTGYALPEETEHYRNAGFGAVLRKPVHPSDIASAIAQMSAVAIESQPAMTAMEN
jgi:CheY-like chemotaxis protein